jgi:hypothetical protein
MSFKILEDSLLLNDIAKCQEHGCPMITVEQDGEKSYMCLFEALDALIGQQRITRLKVSSKCIRSIQFENGYQLIPLCPCCGEPGLQEGGVLLNKMLIGLDWRAVESDEVYPALILRFAKTPDAKSIEELPVHFDSIYTIKKIGG